MLSCNTLSQEIHYFDLVSGTSLGTVISIPTAGIIAGTLGWEAVFYIHGGLACIWLILWAVLISDSPEDNTFISIEEKKYILEHQSTSNTKEGKVSIFSNYLAMTLTVKGLGSLVMPLMTFSGLGAFPGITSIETLCNNLTKKENNSFFANDSPIQILLPTPKGENCSNFFTCSS